MLGHKDDRPVICTSRVNQTMQYGANLRRVQRGELIQVASLADAEIMQAQGLVSIGRVPLEKLAAYERDDALVEKLQRERDRKILEEARREPLPYHDGAPLRHEERLSEARRARLG